LLRSSNTGVINNASDEGNAALGGWLTLIKTYNDYIRQPVQLSQALQSWKSAYPNHVAATFFPKELESLLNFQQTNLAQIGLVLPLSGLSTRRLIICSKRGSTRHTPKQISCSKGKS